MEYHNQKCSALRALAQEKNLRCYNDDCKDVLIARLWRHERRLVQLDPSFENATTYHTLSRSGLKELVKERRVSNGNKKDELIAALVKDDVDMNRLASSRKQSAGNGHQVAENAKSKKGDVAIAKGGNVPSRASSSSSSIQPLPPGISVRGKVPESKNPIRLRLSERSSSSSSDVLAKSIIPALPISGANETGNPDLTHPKILGGSTEISSYTKFEESSVGKQGSTPHPLQNEESNKMDKSQSQSQFTVIPLVKPSCSEPPPKRKVVDTEEVTTTLPTAKKRRIITDETTQETLSSVEFSKLLRGAAVTIHIGSEKVLYSLPKTLVCYFSSVLKTEAGHSDDIYYQDENPNHFDLIVEWMYSNGTKMTVPSTASNTEHGICEFWMQMAQVANRFKLAGTCETFITSKIKDILPAVLLCSDTIYSLDVQPTLKLPDQHPLRLLFLDTMAFEFIPSKEPPKSNSKFIKEEVQDAQGLLMAVSCLLTKIFNDEDGKLYVCHPITRKKKFFESTVSSSTN